MTDQPPSATALSPDAGRVAPGRAGLAHHLAASGERCYLIEPPYHHLQVPRADGRAARCPPLAGVVVAVEVRTDTAGAAELGPTLARLRAMFPSVAFVAIAGPATPAETLRYVRCASALGLSAVLLAGAPLYESLRPLLTDPAELHEEVPRWLALRGVSLSPDLSFVIREIFLAAPRHPGIASLLKSIGESEGGARTRFHKKRLPAPHCWHHAARGIHAALQVQAAPERSLLDIALGLGYSSDSALSRQFMRVFGVRPGQVRGTLGWQWLLGKWDERNLGTMLISS